VVLAIPENINKEKMNRSIVLIITLLLFFTVCSTSKVAAKKTKKAAAKTEQTVDIPEDKRIEFEFLYIEGLKYKMLGNLDNAIQYFNNCLEINPKSAAVLYELANIHTIKGDVTSAKALLEKAIQINPENKWYKLLLAQIYQGNKQYIEASKIYSELIKSDPDNIDYYYLNALLLTSGEKYDEAIKAYKQIEEKMGFNEQVSLARQQLYRTSGKNKEAYAEIERLIKFNPSVPEYYGVMADMYKEDGNKEKALEYYNKVLEIDPTNGFVQFSLVTFYIQNKELDKAYEHAEKGFSDPDTDIETKIQLYLMLATYPGEQKLSDTQIEELIKLISVAHPTDARSYSINADFLIQRNRIPEAREYIVKALEIDANSYPVWEQLVMIDNQISDFENMAKDSEKAIQLFPSQGLLYVLNAVALIQQKDYEKALKTLDNGQTYIIDNKKLEAQFELYRAEAYYNLKNNDKAFSSFEKVIEIEPDNYMAMNNYAYYLSTSNGSLDKAEILSSQVIQANPDNATYLDTHAWVLFKKKEYRLAKFYMETAVKNGGDENDVVVEHYGDILFMLNDIDGAVLNWKKSVELGNKSKILEQKINEKRFIEGDE
jgi:tetratricopeptide (TPR) repeat protein